jgi:hypothetical protein
MDVDYVVFQKKNGPRGISQFHVRCNVVNVTCVKACAMSSHRMYYYEFLPLRTLSQ